MSFLSRSLSLLCCLFFCIVFNSLYGQLGWQTVTSSDTYLNRDEHGYVEVNGKFYLIGGAYMGTPEVQEYDPVSNTWTDKSSVPLDFHHMQPVAYNGEIWLMGAWRGTYGSEIDVSNIWSYNPSTDSWTQHLSIPASRRRGSSGVVVHDDKFYILGGNSGGHGSQGDVKAWVDVFDPQANNGAGSWDTLAPMPIGRDHFQAVVMGDSIFAIGGRDSGVPGNIFATTRTQVDVYDINTNTWSTLPSNLDLPTPRAGASVIPFDEEIIVLLGVGNSRTDDRMEVEAFNVRNLSWRSLPQPNRGRSGTQAIPFGREIFLASGINNSGSRTLNEQEKLFIPNPNSPPYLTDPTNQSVQVGDTVSFEVTAFPLSGLSFQWQYLSPQGWQNISGATQSMYTINAASLGQDSAVFRVVVSNAFGTTISNSAVLRVGCNVVQGNVDPIVIEAENFHDQVPINNQLWQVSQQSGAVGDVIAALPNQGSNFNFNINTLSPSVSYNVDFKQPGTYYLWVRMYAPSFEDNSIHMGLDSVVSPTADKITYNTYNQWGWTNSTMDGPVATLSISQTGIQSLHIWMREDGALIDRIILTQNASYVPTSSGPAATNNCPSGAPFPVEMLEFSTRKLADHIELNWKTRWEQNNAYFEVEKSVNQNEWRSMEQIGGSGTSNEPQTYQWIDRSPWQGANFYRLKQVDLNGSFTYSEIKEVSWQGEAWGRLRVWPNPLEDGRLKVSIESKDDQGSLAILDLRGRKHWAREVSLSNRRIHEATYDLDRLAAGIYFVRWQSANYTQTQKIIVK